MSKQPVPVVAAVFYQLHETSEPEILLCRRAPHVSGAGSWEFPGGKVDPGETEAAALVREIEEELGIQIKVESKIGSVEHDYGKKLIHLEAYFAQPVQPWKQVQLRLVDHDDHKWVTEKTLILNELAPADRPLVKILFQQLRQKLF